MADRTPSPQPESPEPLKVVAYRYVPSDVWREVVLTEAPAKASLAKELGRTVDELVLKYDAEAAIQAARNEAEAMRAKGNAVLVPADQLRELQADARRWRAARGVHCNVVWVHIGAGACNGELDRAIDAAMKGDTHA